MLAHTDSVPLLPLPHSYCLFRPWSPRRRDTSPYIWMLTPQISPCTRIRAGCAVKQGQDLSMDKPVRLSKGFTH